MVRVLDYEDAPTRLYVVMEYVDGFSGSDLIGQSGRVAPGRAGEILLQVADGLDAAHQLGIVHRDVKPGNVLVTRAGTSKPVDLGLAVVQRADGAAARPDLLPAEGTVGYMSPEQVKGGRGPDRRSDIYSLGATLFHLVTGRLPFTGRSANEVMLKHLHQPPPAAHDAVPGLTPELSQVIIRMTAKDPAERMQDYAEVRRELEAVG